MKQLDKEQFIYVCESSVTMAEAASTLGLHFNTFKRYAIKFGCYRPNQSGKGMKKEWKKSPILTSDILEGKYPTYQTYKLKCRMIDEGIIEDKCQLCGWNEKIEGEKYTPCELHHKDGNPRNHLLSNLILLCPNCHSLTRTYRSRNRNSQKENSD